VNTHDIIAIGGSAGSFDALKQLFADLPADLPASLFVVRHILPGHDDLSASILGEAGPFAVRTAIDGDMIEHGVAYLAPGGRHLMVDGGRILLGRGPRENMARPAVDATFRSVALNYGPRVIGVVLSGLLDDGAAGLAAIRKCGGAAIVQDPADCSAPDMPMSALDACEVDYRFPAARMAQGLVRLANEPAAPAPPVPPDIALEVQIAAGRPSTTDTLLRIATPVALSCPACTGVLSQITDPARLRFRCQIGHAYTAETLDEAQDESVAEAIGIAIRVLEERHTLLTKMADDATGRGHRASAVQFADRAVEYRQQADKLRKVIMGDLP
jgi:two-component system, chemotaxis family, protein-glutamate methylesterase/glutaminase